jgi:biopolymer transport protein TolR
MGASVGRSRRHGFREINVTPFVDVMLVLLVVFIVTAPLLASGLKIELPRVQATNAPVKEGRLVANVTADGHVLLGEEDITGHIAETFAKSAKLQAEKVLYIRGDKEARYGLVAEVVAAARETGVTALNLLVDPLPPRPLPGLSAPLPNRP